MKKFPGLSLLLATVLVLQMLFVPAFAVETEAETPDTAAESSDEIVETGSEGTTEPTDPSTEFTIPENISGDASVNAGCNSINAAQALIETNALELDLKAALMYELNSDTLLYAMNPDEKMYPASVTKLMTCLIALEKGNVEDIVTVSEAVAASTDPDGSNAKLQAGEEISLKDLLYCLMVKSANDAAATIAEYIGGSEAAFVEMMNDKAAELGCSNTHFVNPHGLHDENHYTCARDLAKILMAALEYDLFQEIYSTKIYEVPATNKSEARRLVTTNYMIEKSNIEYYYDERVIGGKTGFTTPAGRCFAGVSESGDLKLLTVVMGGTTSLSDSGLAIYGSFEETGNLIEYAFDNFTSGQLLSPDAYLTSFPVTGGENDTQAVVKEAVSAVVPLDMPKSQLRYEYLLDDGTLSAPIQAGQALGVVRVWYQSNCLAQEEIYATVDSPVKEAVAATDPAVSNTAVQEGSDILQIVLIIILILLALILLMIVISMIRSSMLRARRRKQRRNQRRRRR